MTYDIYCYKSMSNRPDLAEAEEAIASKDDPSTMPGTDTTTKLNIAKSLVSFNPRLESVEFEFAEIADLMGITVEEARQQFNHIEFNTFQSDLNTQISIFDNLVCVSVPYYYVGKDAVHLFKNLNKYLKIIANVSGYHVYDPQTVQVFDPMSADLAGLNVYVRISEKHKANKL